ncbi:MAG TPA: formate/nitrite transporter family protein [Acidimicrobiales bacterium]|nr:formate/nitrite transporter family protein [Acidimicrobiales bacterium]
MRRFARPARRTATSDDEESGVHSAFERTVEEGEDRLLKSWPQLFATGLVGGIDVAFGVFAQIIVRYYTHNELLGAMAFTIGFFAVTLANSELFTESFLVPVVAVVAGKAGPLHLARLWGCTLVFNLIGGWVLTGLTMAAFPKFHETAIEVSRHYVEAGIGWSFLASALLGGAVLTLMTWMERSTPSVPAKLLAVFSVGFIVAAAPLAHAVVSSFEVFSALHAGAPFGYLDWLGAESWTALWNLVGGLLLVTTLRLVQVGVGQVDEERGEAGERTIKEAGGGKGPSTPPDKD